VNVFTAPTCCETLAKYQIDFAQAVLTPSSLAVTTTGNQTSDAKSLVVNLSTASGYPRLGTGSFAAAYGTNLAASTAVASPPFPSSLGGVSVTLKDSAGRVFSAPVQSVSPTQVNYLVPDGASPGIATVTIGPSSGSAQIDAVGPGLYTITGDGKGVAAATAALYTADGRIVPQAVFQGNVAACISSPMLPIPNFGRVERPAGPPPGRYRQHLQLHIEFSRCCSWIP